MKKIISCMLVIVLIFTSFNTITINANITGKSRFFTCWRYVNPSGGIEPVACFRVGLEQQDIKVPIDYSEDCTKSMKDSDRR